MKRIVPVYLLACVLSGVAETLWTEGFERIFPPAEWTHLSVEQKDTYAFDGTYSAKLGASADYLITPEIISGQNLVFWSYTTSADPDILVDHASSTNGPWTEFPESPFSDYTEQWNGRWIDLTIHSNIYIRFRKSGSGTLYVDDISIEDDTPAENQPPILDPIDNPIVFVGDTLTFSITATDPDNNSLMLSASNLPPRAVFNTNNHTFVWSNASPAGIYKPTFYVSDGFTNNSETVTITAENRAQIEGMFYGWNNDTIVKLDNGLFWKNNGGIGPEVNPPLRNPCVTVTNWLQNGVWRIYVNEEEYTTAVLIHTIESTLASPFNGLHNGTTHRLTDGTTWEQTSFENIPASADSVMIWRWVEGNQTQLRFLDRDNLVIGTCTVKETTAPTHSTVISEMDGIFYGWKHRRVFALANGQFWQQTNLARSSDHTSRPAVTITNWLESGIWRMTVDDSTVEVQRLTNVIHSTLEGEFHGFENNRLFHLANNDWWRQISIESTESSLSNPGVFLWSENGIDYLEIPEAGETVIAEKLSNLRESTITNTFKGLHYGNLYRLAGADDWIQISSEITNRFIIDPEVMLWTEGEETKMVVRDGNDQTIGICTLADPNDDSDGDQITNSAELIAGTDLFDKQSKFKTASISRDGMGHYVLQWEAVKGRTYAIDWSPAITERFQPWETHIVWPQNSWTDTVHTTDNQSFYRLNVRLSD